MRHVNGYIFLAYLGDYSVFMMGKKVDPRQKKNYENIEGNSLTTYPTREEAEKSREEFERERGVETKTAKLEMKIAETDAELTEFERDESLVAIMKVRDFGTPIETLYGPFVKGRPGKYPLPGAKITENGFETFKTIKGDNNQIKSAFDKAYYLASEIARQGQCPATIATFKLELL